MRQAEARQAEARQAEAHQAEARQAEAHQAAVEQVDTQLAAAMHQVEAHRAEAHRAGKPTAVAMLRAGTLQAVLAPVDRQAPVDQARIRVVPQPVVSPAAAATARVATVE
jgi:hypothetical protein